MANRKLGNLKNLVKLGNIITSFLISEFLILPYSQNQKFGLENLGKKFPRFPRFPNFWPGPLESLELIASTHPANWDANFDGCARKLQKISCKTFHKTNYLLNFVNLSTLFCRTFIQWLFVSQNIAGTKYQLPDIFSSSAVIS